jgi:hypothetical protein
MVKELYLITCWLDGPRIFLDVSVDVLLLALGKNLNMGSKFYCMTKHTFLYKCDYPPFWPWASHPKSAPSPPYQSQQPRPANCLWPLGVAKTYKDTF